jgi:uncharacterized protein YfcZ (UPF0381/DUF406 family)
MSSFTPRIVVDITNENVKCRGHYIDKFERMQSFSRVYNTEAEANDYLDSMRDTNEFSLQVNRNNWRA